MWEMEQEAHGGHRNRLRQRVRIEGFEGMEPHEILEFLLTYAIPRQDVNALAHALLERFGSVWNVLNAENQALCRVEGVGKRTAQWLMLLGEAVGACAALQPEDKLSLKGYLDVFRYALALRREVETPCCVQLLLDMDFRLIFRREICPSLSWGEPETLREALGDALRMSARSAIVLVFPDGRLLPKEYDVYHAENYACALRAAGSDLLDVVFASPGDVHSMRRMGLIPDCGGDEILRMVREDYLKQKDLKEDT